MATALPRPDASTDFAAVVRELYASFQNGDVEAMLTRISSDVEWSEPDNPFNPAGGTRRGHSGFLEWLLARATGRIYESDFVHVVTFKDGKVARFQEFFDTYLAGEAFRSPGHQAVSDDAVS